MHDVRDRAHGAKMRFIGDRAEDKRKREAEGCDGYGEINWIYHQACILPRHQSLLGLIWAQRRASSQLVIARSTATKQS